MTQFTPDSIEEAAERIRGAQGRETLVATGERRHLDTAPLADSSTLVDLGAFCDTTEHRPGDMTVTVGSRVGFAALQTALAGHGQWLPLDPPAAAATTIGGLIAADLAGPLRSSQGRVRDHLIGIEVLDGNGARLCSGGRVVKNVAGYDTAKLHVGACGTLGWILEATFKVRPLPRAEAALSLDSASPADAARQAPGLRDLHEPGWLEIEHDAEGTRLWAALLGESADVDHGLERWRNAAPGSEEVRDPASCRALLADALAPKDRCVVKAALLPGDLPALLEATTEGADSLYAQPLTGNARFLFAHIQEAADFLLRFRPQVEARGGWLTLERADAASHAALAADIAPLGRKPEGLGLMQGVRAVFDPADVFDKTRTGWAD